MSPLQQPRSMEKPTLPKKLPEPPKFMKQINKIKQWLCIHYLFLWHFNKLHLLIVINWNLYFKWQKRKSKRSLSNPKTQNTKWRSISDSEGDSKCSIPIWANLLKAIWVNSNKPWTGQPTHSQSYHSRIRGSQKLLNLSNSTCIWEMST